MGPCSAHAGQYMQMGFVPAHLYKARASELQQGRRFRLDYCMLKHICTNLSIRVAKASALHRLLHSDIHAHGSISLYLSLIQTLVKHICTRLGIGDPITATRTLTTDPSPGTLYKPGQQSSKNVYAPAAVARRSPI